MLNKIKIAAVAVVCFSLMGFMTKVSFDYYFINRIETYTLKDFCGQKVQLHMDPIMNPALNEPICRLIINEKIVEVTFSEYNELENGDEVRCE